MQALQTGVIQEQRCELQPTPHFDFALALRYLRGSPGSILEAVDQTAYRRALTIERKDVLITVSSKSNAINQPLEVLAQGADLTSADLPGIARWVERTFSTSADTTGLDALGDTDPIFARVLAACRGLRPILMPSVFEALCWAIIGQQINVTFAAKCKRALAERYGRRLTVDGVSYLLFPSATVLASLQESELAPLQFSRQKSRYVINAARRVAEGTLDLEALADQPAEAVLEHLQELTGVGRWTAEYVLMRGLGYRDAIPAADGGLRRIIGQAYGYGRNATEEEVRALAQHWAGWRSYAAFYWWFTLQNPLSG